MLNNPYLENIKRFVNNRMLEESIQHFSGPYQVGLPPPRATWHDKAWQYVNEKGKVSNFIFCEGTTSQTRISNLGNFKLIDSPWHELLKLYALYLTPQHLSSINKRKKVSTAREFILFSNFFKSFEPDEVLNYWKSYGGKKNGCLLNSFINWLRQNKLVPANIPKVELRHYSKPAAEVIAERAKKLPDEKVIIAMGAIQNQVIPWNKSDWSAAHPLTLQRDAFTCAMFALSISSPNRVEAEQTVLNMQKLKTYSTTKNNNKDEVHYLEWSGSKGYGDNKKHILTSTAPLIALNLEYMESITEQNRILARFYKNPELPLKMLLGRYKPISKSWCYHINKADRSTNLFALGHILGFYEHTTDQKIFVEPGTSGAKKHVTRKPSKTRYYKYIYKLSSEDRITLNATQIRKLFAINSSNALYSRLSLKECSTILDIQTAWIRYLKEQYPNFPLVRNNASQGSCDIEFRLFALNSFQLGLNGIRGGNDYVASNSPFAIISPATMGKVYVNDLGASKKTNQSIFQRFGFSDSFHISPHQMRHFLSDQADKGGLPMVINNMWGGRKDLSQLINYIHSTDVEKGSVISDILFDDSSKPESDIKKSLRITTLESYESCTNEYNAASITSSGICTQNLMVTPCSYLNDLNTQCVGCLKSCHVAHDTDSISLLKKDMAAQSLRLEDVKSRPQFRNSTAMQSWFAIHLNSTERLKQLIALMEDSSIEPGSAIRMVQASNEFRITNLHTKITSIKPLLLPNAENEIQKVLSEINTSSDDTTSKLLESI
ncbi:MAG: hypothetical protein HWE16_11400 [Gammaproteobacteria bacterium]|nr:hypothetical protein [Gammaproteobacteria bacterium]